MSATSKPGQDPSQRRPDVEIGDEVYFNHPNGPMSGKVRAAGAHGCTLQTGKVTHKIRWQHIVGHKKRAPQNYEIKERGEDGHIVEDAQGRRRFMMIPNEAKDDPLVVKAERGAKPITKKPVGTFKPGQTVKFKLGAMSGSGAVVGRPGPKGAYVKDATGHLHQVEWEKMEADEPAAGDPLADMTAALNSAS